MDVDSKQEEGAKGLSEDLEKLYDRQIRIWGIQGQARMMAAKVLIVGAAGLGAEIAKNIVLAGIGELTVLDGSVISEFDLGSHWFATKDDVGQNRASVLVNCLRKLNPNPKLIADHECASKKSDEFFKTFHSICVTGQPLAVQVRVNNFCRGPKRRFYSSDVFGRTAFVFSDLHDHEYVREKKNDLMETRKEKETMSFVPLPEVLSLPWAMIKKMYTRRRKNTCHLFLGIQVMYIYEFKYGKMPDPNNEKDMNALFVIRDAEIHKQKLNNSELPDEALRYLASDGASEVSTTCSVAGGVLGQEILNGISADRKPLENVWVYSEYNNVGGIVKHFTSKGSVKRKDFTTVEIEETETIEL